MKKVIVVFLVEARDLDDFRGSILEWESHAPCYTMEITSIEEED